MLHLFCFPDALCFPVLIIEPRGNKKKIALYLSPHKVTDKINHLNL